MNSKLDEALCAKYPKIFKDRHGDMKETLMCWGFECGDGWYNIIDELCVKIQNHIDETGKQQIEAEQVKEKYGTLRFYTNYYDEIIEEYIAQAEQQTYNICEICGSTNDIQRTKGWISYQCATCREIK